MKCAILVGILGNADLRFSGKPIGLPSNSIRFLVPETESSYLLLSVDFFKNVKIQIPETLTNSSSYRMILIHDKIPLEQNFIPQTKPANLQHHTSYKNVSLMSRFTQNSM